MSAANPLKGLKVHVEGMGLTGCLLAPHLESWGCRWTWHDADAPVTAWKASTGAIFPAGQKGSLDWECWRVWAEWLNGKSPYPRDPHFEPASYWFNHVAPPHHGHYPFHPTGKHGLRVAEPQSYHLNAQTFVPAMRRKYKARHQPNGARRGYARVVAHGFSTRLHHVLWGWAVPVVLQLPHYMTDALRPALYLRRGRFVMCYAYPTPGTPWWYAGSSLIHQRQPGELEVEAKFERWLKQLAELSKGAVKVTRRGPSLQGWRPVPVEPHAPPVWQRSTSGALLAPPLWHSGIRHFPRVLQLLRTELELLGRRS